jgi:Uma2 family endonuclease
VGYSRAAPCRPAEAIAASRTESSLRIDRGIKRQIYAEAGVPEHWIIDVTKATIEVHTQPMDGRYTRVETLRDGDVLRPTLLPEVAIRVAELPR